MPAFDNAVDALELSQRTFPPMRWIIPGIIPIGATLLAAPEKIGKSWWALQLARAISKQGEVLYLALEDTEESLQWRLNQQPGVILSTLTLVPQGGNFLPITKGGAKQISQWLTEAHDPLLVIVDTLEKVRGDDSGRPYRADYKAIEPFKAIAGKHRVAIVILHHLNQNVPKPGEDAGDPVYRINGTSGLTGAADTILELERDRLLPDGTLFTTGRCVETTRQPITWDKSTFSWSLTAPPAMPKNIVADLVAEKGAMSRTDVCKELGAWAVRRVEDALVLGLLVEENGVLRFPASNAPNVRQIGGETSDASTHEAPNGYHHPLASPIQRTSGTIPSTNAIMVPETLPNTSDDLHIQSRILTSPLPGSPGVP